MTRGESGHLICPHIVGVNRLRAAPTTATDTPPSGSPRTCMGICSRPLAEHEPLRMLPNFGPFLPVGVTDAPTMRPSGPPTRKRLGACGVRPSL